MTDTPSALAFRVWDLDRQNDRLISFNARPKTRPPWWVADAFATPLGGWPPDHALKAECIKNVHEPHDPDDCEVPGCEHDGRIPDPRCMCGIYSTRSIPVISDYLRQAREPVLGIIEAGGRFIPGEPGREGYGRAEYARVAAILLIDRSLTIDHSTLRRLADAYHVPALRPHSTDADDYRDRITVTSALADQAEEWLRRQAGS
jgi:hypothetical protein